LKAVLDACVIYPSVLRGILLGVAARGLYVPLWSERIVEEWQRASKKLGPQAVAEAQMAALQMRVAFPGAMLRAQPAIEARLVLPDENDRHVLAVAIAGGADAIITFNATDFPGHVLAGEGIVRRDPDGFLWELWSHHPESVTQVINGVHAQAEAMAGAPLSLKGLLKRSRLNRLARAMAAV
jgi:predicted nucleic acid-binding protein